MIRFAKEYQGSKFALAWLIASALAGCATAPPSAPPVAATPTAEVYPAAPAREQLPVQTSEPVELRADAPTQYVVKKGDTLWDIAGRFLSRPWHWPEIWNVNPSIKNPHRIYPGDVLSLYYVDGKPQLRLSERGGRKLTPQIRYESLAEEDYGIPIQAIQPFLIRPQVIAEEQLKEAAHVLDSQERRLIYGTDDRIYARGLRDDAIGTRYSVFRPGRELRDPLTRELLGYEAVHASDAEVIRSGEPATVVLVDAVREVLRGDRLLSLDPGSEGLYFVPHAPAPGVAGEIIGLFDALSQSALYQIAVINLGQRNGVEAGHVLAVSQAGRVVSDLHHKRTETPKIALPSEHSGVMMVFRSFEKVSYALIMESVRSMRVGDIVAAP
ncbi:MAG: LysM peptidoglycan-binding domain-containing protein [Thiotrichales bacterium]